MAFIYDLTDTWNAGGTAFNGIKMNVTDTASAAASRLMTLQVGGAERFSVTKAGVGYFSGNVEIAASGSSKLRINSTNAQTPTIDLFRTGGTGYQITADSSVIFSINRISSAGAVTATPLTINSGNTATFAGVIQTIGASATAPSFSFSADTDTGIFQAGANILAASTGGSERLRVDSSGNVAINNTSPTERLDVSGNIRVRGNLGIFNSPPSDFWAINALNSGVFVGYGNVASQGSFSLDITANGYRNSSGTWTTLNTNGSTSAAQIRLQTSDGAIVFGSDATKATGSGIAVTERMRITSAGLVGIGTSSPAEILHLSRDSSLALRIERTGASASVGELLNGGNLLTLSYNLTAITFNTGASPTERMRLDASGNLMVGKTANDDTTQGARIAGGGLISIVRDGNVSLILNRNTSDGATAFFRRSGTTVGSISVTTTATSYNTSSTSGITGVDANTVAFQTNSAERMRIDATGRVGIGCSPITPFQISLGVDRRFSVYPISNQNFFGFLTDSGSVADTALSGNPLRFATGVTERMRIDASGNLLVGTTSVIPGAAVAGIQVYSPSNVGRINYGKTTTGTQNAAVFYHNGTVVGSITYSDTATAYNTSSDARLKHDIVDAPEASGLIDAIKVRSFKWNADDSEQRYGFVAQELVEVAPEAVSVPTDEDEMMGVDYSKLVPMLVKELQSVRARLAQLEGN
jgi:hypothetical protein